MKLHLLAFLGLVAMATATIREDEFLVIDDESERNDLDPLVIEALQSNGTVQSSLEALLQLDTLNSLKTAKVEDTPPAYSLVARGSAAMFDDNSATNGLEDSLTELSPVSASNTREKRHATSLYFCPHRNYLLRWFPLYSGWRLNDICFVPWASNQAVTYAKCTKPTCALNNQRKGRCRPSCYIRRRMLVICFNFRLRQWRWRWVVRNLPQACRCSTC
ncbi:uncharacterized protein [Littorina saxatilis]|uniref:uncharacterized protein n=1 Tax=Littorina saxatilis TaxID=31220 RepID=UPI0038B4A5AB